MLDIPSRIDGNTSSYLDTAEREGRASGSLSSIELAIHRPSQEPQLMMPEIRFDSEPDVATFATNTASESRHTSSLAPVDGGSAAWSFVC
jgi:hypothetical protein